MILTQHLPTTDARGGATTDAFHATFWSLTVAAAAALLAAGWLVIEQRRTVSSQRTA